MYKIKKVNWKCLIISIAIPLIVGGLSALLTKNNMKEYLQLSKPNFAPPGIVFPIVWTVLFILMGISSYMVFNSGLEKYNVIIYSVQLIFNFFWTIIFFNYNAYKLSFIWILLLWILVVTMIILFSRTNKIAAYLQIPYLLWISYAAILNYYFAFVNY